MAYPERVDLFSEKLNKRPAGTLHVVEEKLELAEGAFSGPLRHDNINNQSVRVYSGPRFTGERITNWTLSVPEDTPWRRHIRVFAGAAEVYVTYETPGDTVEADDVNVLQDALTATQTEVERYKGANDVRLNDVRDRLAAAESGKADKTWAETQLLTKADKAAVYTKAETDTRIQAVVGAAPEALDTLKEIAEALDNDPDFAGTMTVQLAGKVDKEAGKGLSSSDYTSAEKAKLAGIAAGAGTAGSAADAIIGNRTISDAAAPSADTGSVTALLGGLAHMVKAVTGGSGWRTLPVITLAAIKALLDAATPEAKAGVLMKRDANGRAKAAAPAAADDIARKAEVDAARTAAVDEAVEAAAADAAGKADAAKAGAIAAAAADAAAKAEAARASAVAEAADDAAGRAQAVQEALTAHAGDAVRHVSAAEPSAWNAKASTAGASGTAAGLMSAADKAKLDGVAAGANSYTHPATHPPSIIAQDASNRFVTDAEKATWNAKASTAGASGTAAGLMSAADKAKLDGGAAGAQVNAVTSVAGRTGAVTVGKSDVGLGTVENYGIATQTEAEAGTSAAKYMTPLRTTQAINARIANVGGGDMLKSLYDPDGDGKVSAADAADAVPWAGVTGKPSAYAPSAHVHAAADITSGTVAPARLPSASLTAAGIVQLSSSTSSTSTALAATPAAVKAAYDLAAARLGPGVTWNQLKGV